MMDILAGFFLIAGSTLSLTAAIGLVRFPEVFTRMHAGTKPQTLGLLLILLGLGLRLQDVGATAMLVVVAMFQLLTSPVSAHIVGRAVFRTGGVSRESLVVDELSDDT